MKRRSLWLVFSFVLAFPVFGQAPVIQTADFAKDRLLVKFKKGASDKAINNLAQARGMSRIHRLGGNRPAPGLMKRWRGVRYNDKRNIKAEARLLAKHPLVERVELDYKIKHNAIPNDPRFNELWGLHNTGQTYGTADADIDAVEAWNVETGASNTVLVAVIDSGVDYTHADLAANMWTNPGEIAGNGIDDDNNGYVDDVHGFNFTYYDGDPMDDYGHGTHVAGTIAATGNNDIGITGVNWNARIMAIKFLDSFGNGFTSDAISAILYATQMNARIINSSWGGGSFSQALLDAILEANNANILFVASAGNSYNDNDLSPHYPSSYEAPNVIAVAATNHIDGLSYFSNYGSISVDLGAPGEAILSTTPGNTYSSYDGTSMAAPHVSGAASLLLAQDPGLTMTELKNLIFTNVDPIPSISGYTTTGGRLNIHSALTCNSSQFVLAESQPVNNFKIYLEEPALIAVSAVSCSNMITGVTITATINGTEVITLYDDGTHGDGAANDGNYANSWQPLQAGSLDIRFDANHATFGSSSLSISGQIVERFSYTYSAEPYNWIDASAGTAHVLGDDSSVEISTGFEFNYQGENYSTIHIGSNGIIGFGGPVTNYDNAPIPTDTAPNNFIAPFWDDLNPSAGGMIYSLLEGTAPNRSLTIAWVDVPQYSTIDGISFAVTLYEGSNEIVFRYQDVIFGDITYDNGASATIGLENQNGSQGNSYSYNSSLIQDGQALRFVPGPYNRAPVANAGGPYTGYPNSPITFNGAASYDNEGDNLSYYWEFGDSETATGVSPSHTYTYRGEGTYTVTLTVSDGINTSQPVTTTVTLLNRAPVASIDAPATGDRNLPTNFGGYNSTDPDGDNIQRYIWDFGDGTGPVETGHFIESHHYTQLGTYTVTLVVDDGTMLSEPVSQQISIVNLLPWASAGSDLYVITRRGVTLYGAGYDTDGQITQYQWRQISGPTVDLINATTNYAYFVAPGLKGQSQVLLEFELTVTDNDGATATDTAIITVVK